MDRRRAIQQAYNIEHGATPVSIVKSTAEVRLSTHVADARTAGAAAAAARKAPVAPDLHDPKQRAAAMTALEKQMKQAAANLEFELAAMLRDQLNDLRAHAAPDVRRSAPARPFRRRV
jgi:excinuclease ABC subunit B